MQPVFNSVRRGYTLTDVAMAVGAMVLCAAIAGPQFSLARNRSQREIDLQNMQLHIFATWAYGVEHKDTLPNAPISPGGRLESLWGKAGQIPKVIAGLERPVNGWAFPYLGIRAFYIPGSIASLNLSSEWESLELWNGYWIVLGEYFMTGGSIQTMKGPIWSPADPYRMETLQLLQQYVQDNGALPEIPSAAITRWQVPSYRYSWGCLVNPDLFSFDRNDEPALADPTSGIPRNININTLQERVRPNPTAAVSYPSSKVLFYMWWSNYEWNLVPEYPDTRALVSYPGATTPVAMADGSARWVEPSVEGLQADKQENTGPYYDIHYSSNPDYTWPGHFWINIGGVRGREL